MNDMKTKLVDFDIEKARNGAKVVAEYVDKDFTRPCRIVCYDAKGEFPIVALIYYECYKGDRIHTFNAQGRNDLFHLKIEEEVFEDGDIIASGSPHSCSSIGIFKNTSESYGDGHDDYADLLCYDEEVIYDNTCLNTQTLRSATEEEKQRLFDALAKEGKRWNSEKKCIEELPRKTSVFKPFDKVLVRDGDIDTWGADIFLEYSNLEFQFRCFRCVWRQCIPYEGNESLLGTSNKPIIL